MIIIQQKKNTEKYINFSVPIKTELDNDKTITYKLEFIDSFRFMSTALSKLADNLSEIFSKKCTDKNCKSECDFKRLKNNNFLIIAKSLEKKQLKIINGLIKKFPEIHINFAIMILTSLFCN